MQNLAPDDSKLNVYLFHRVEHPKMFIQFFCYLKIDPKTDWNSQM